MTAGLLGRFPKAGGKLLFWNLPVWPLVNKSINTYVSFYVPSSSQPQDVLALLHQFANTLPRGSQLIFNHLDGLGAGQDTERGRDS